MSTYNEEERVSKAIESIVDQSFKNFEFLILDDKSTDNTYDILKSYSKKEHWTYKVFKSSYIKIKREIYS